MAYAPRGLLIGLIQVGNLSRARRDAARIDLALKANEEGYALVETFEVAGDPTRDEGTYAAIEALAAQIDAQAVMTVGEVDLERVNEIADRVRLRVLSSDQ